MKSLGLLSSCVVAILVVATSIVTPALASDSDVCIKFYKTDYVNKPDHKAFATTGGRSMIRKGHVSCGVSTDSGTLLQAKKLAVLECQEHAVEIGDTGKCVVIYSK